MAFVIEWTGRSFGNALDEQRAIDAAEEYCAQNAIDPQQAWDAQIAEIEAGEDPDRGQHSWFAIESYALTALFDGWENIADNVALTYR